MRFHSALLVISIFLFTFIACNGGGDRTPTVPTYPVGKPTGVDAEAGNQSATITWNAVAGATGYYVYMSTDGSSFTRYQGLVEGTEFKVLSLANGATYYFGVSAVGSGGWESSISYAGGAPLADGVVPGGGGPPPPPYEGPPDPPENLQGIAKDSSCEINWDPSPSDDLAYYKIYRATADISGFSIWPVLVDGYVGLAYRDEDLTNGNNYSYRITAVDTEFPPLESVHSNEVTLTPMDFPPEILNNVEIYVNPGRILLEWDVPIEPDITEYAIERVEGTDPTTGAEIVTRFVIQKPTQTFDDPHEYIGGLVLVWVDLQRNRIDVQDMAVIVGVLYKYRIAAIDATDQEGPPVTVTAPTQVF